MKLTRQARQRAKITGIAAAAVAAILATGAMVGASTSANYAPPVSEKVASAYAQATEIAAKGDQPLLDPALLTAGTRAVIFGDSWTEGYVADPLSHGYAYKTVKTLGLAAKVDGARGSGYLNGGEGGKTFAARLAEGAPDKSVKLLIIQGSVNDEGAAGNYPAAVDAALVAAKTRYPAARIVLLAPAPASLPARDSLKQIDQTLSAASLRHGHLFISPIREDWINEGNYAKVIDSSATGLNHPSSKGHEYLAGKVVQALKELAA